MFKQLWNDDAGIVTVEYLVLGTFLALALIVGVATLASAINSELSELGQAIQSFSQGYYVSGQSSCVAAVEGSSASDSPGTNHINKTSIGQTATISDSSCD